jgi:hypothetical protein
MLGVLSIDQILEHMTMKSFKSKIELIGMDSNALLAIVENPEEWTESTINNASELLQLRDREQKLDELGNFDYDMCVD